MSALVLTYTAVANTVAPSASYNLNNTEIVNWSTTIDHSNTVGSTGFWASDIKPLTAAEATFGLTAVGVGYKFLGNDATAVPLTISGVSGQSADILDVTTTSGGVIGFGVDSSGAVKFGGGAFTATTVVGISGDGGATKGMLLNVPTGSTNGFRFQTNGATFAQLTAGGQLTLNGAFATSNGDLGVARGTNTGAIWFGTSANQGAMDYNIANASSFSFSSNPASPGYRAVFGGLYTNASDAALKANVAPIAGALATLAHLKPSSYEWIADKQGDLGFIAQDVAQILPQLTRTDKHGSMGLVYSGLTALAIAAIQDLNAKVDTYIAAHP